MRGYKKYNLILTYFNKTYLDLSDHLDEWLANGHHGGDDYHRRLLTYCRFHKDEVGRFFFELADVCESAQKNGRGNKFSIMEPFLSILEVVFNEDKPNLDWRHNLDDRIFAWEVKLRRYDYYLRRKAVSKLLQGTANVIQKVFKVRRECDRNGNKYISVSIF